MQEPPVRRRGRVPWPQWRLGTMLLLVTLAGMLFGWLGPRIYHSLQATPAPRIPSNFRREFPASVEDDLPAYYLEPAETPLN